MKFLYIKGGSAIQSVEKLYSFTGDIPNTGPHQFFLSIKKITEPHDLRVVSINNEDNRLKKERFEAIEYGARVKGNVFVKALKFIIFGVKFIFQTVKYKPDVIFYNLDGVFSFFAVLSGKLCKSKLVYLSHNANNISSVSKLNRAFNRILIKFADQVMVHGPFLHAQARSLGANELVINEYDTWSVLVKTDFVSPPSVEDKKLVILFLGRIEENKGVWDLIEAYDQLQVHEKAELWFIGTGSLYPEIKSSVSKLKSASGIKFFGSVPHESVLDYIKKSDCLVTPTRTSFPEGRCMSVMESFTLGRLVIAPDFGPFPYLVKDGLNGFLYQPDSVEDLKNKIEIFINDPNQREALSRNAKLFAREGYENQQVFFSVLQRVFNKMMSE